MAVKKAAPVKKAAAAKAPAKKRASAVKAGESYTCEVCGFAVTVDEVCGCVETHEMICCEQPMKPVKAKKIPVKAK